jgi:hypothetical protein
MALQYVPYAVSGLASLYKYKTRKKRQPFEQTEYGKTLKTIGEQGKYSPTTKGKILGEFHPTGNMPTFFDEFKRRGIPLPEDTFKLK